MQLGRRTEYLKRCIRVNELLSEHESATSVRKRVFALYIKPQVHCSYTTFNNMLNEPNPQRQLDAIHEQLKELTT